MAAGTNIIRYHRCGACSVNFKSVEQLEEFEVAELQARRESIARQHRRERA